MQFSVLCLKIKFVGKDKYMDGENSVLNQDYRILIVDDNEINIKILFKILTNEGFYVEAAEDGDEAVRKFSKSSEGYYSLIIMDVRMPVLDGIEATEKIRSIKRRDAEKIPIIAYTANCEDDEIECAKQAGMNDYIIKPVSPECLKKIVNKWIYDR